MGKFPLPCELFWGEYITLIFQSTQNVAKWNLLETTLISQGNEMFHLNRDFLEEEKIRSPGYISEKYLHQKKVSHI